MLKLARLFGNHEEDNKKQGIIVAENGFPAVPWAHFQLLLQKNIERV